ncbi:lipopolysaccharide biosynthesis protein [Methylocystis parvus]|nr:lipopolysaccharide biosynthesis protein [Methylocystis parvus]WBJ98773.1 lipopolysaccharide biosynthesis protein [Methylocystis parvus OBBP]
MAEHIRKLLRSTILYLPAQFAPPFVQFVTTIAWTYLLDPATFGFVNFIIAVQEIVAYAGLTGWTLFVLRFRERFRDRGTERFVAMDQRMAALGALLQILLAPLVLFLLDLPLDAATVAGTAAYLVTRMLVAHYSDWARADHAIRAYSAAQIIASVAGAALSILAILTYGPVAGVVLGAQAAGQALAIAALVLMKQFRFGLGAFDRELFAELRRYAAPILVGGVIGWGAGNVIRVLVQYMDGPVALGLISVGWGVGQRIASVLAMLLTAAAYPLAVKHYEDGDRRGALAQVSFNGLLLFAVLLPAAVGLAMLAEPVVTLLIAEKFREATISVLPIAMAAASLRFLRIHTCEQSMFLVERPALTLYVLSVEAVLNIAFCAIGLHVGGFSGAAAGMLIGTAITTFGAFAYCFVKLDLPPPSFAAILKICAASGVMGLALSVAETSAHAGALAAAILSGASIYAALILVFFPEIRALVARRLQRAYSEATL